MNVFAALLVVALLFLPAGPAPAADESKVKQATRQVEQGAKKLGEGIEDTAKGIGKTTVEGAKAAGEKLKESGKAAEPQAKRAWENVRDGAVSFGQGVKSFFSRMFSSD